MAGTHARLSASSAERFITCPGSVKLSELLPPEEESEFAAEGTAAHSLGERCLREETDAFMYIGETIDDFEVTAEMANAVQVYVDYVRERADGETLLIEHTIDNTGMGPDFGGTSDAVINGIVDGGGYIHVNDYKHGIGIAVEIEKDQVPNKQLMYYAYGELREMGITMGDDISVGLTIIQPRAYHSDGPIREVWTSSDYIIAWAETELIPAMKRVDSDDTPFSEGEHCRFCPAKIVCPRMLENFEVLAMSDTKELPNYSDEEIAAQYARIATVKMYINALTAECKKRALAGTAVPGTKLVYGRSTRMWKPEAEAALLERYGEDVYSEPTLLSPAKIEELPEGKQFTGRLSYKNKGKPTLVAEGDKGEPYDATKEGEGFAAVPKT